MEINPFEHLKAAEGFANGGGSYHGLTSGM
jgi:hypothetical protein